MTFEASPANTSTEQPSTEATDVTPETASAAPEDAGGAEQSDVNEALSSEAQGESPEEPKSMLEAVTKSVTAEDTDGAAEQEPEGEDGQAEDAEAGKAEEPVAEDDLPDDVTDEELKGYKPKVQRRIQKLLDQRKALEGPARQFEKISTFMQENGLDAQAAANAMQAAAMVQKAMNGQADPREALKHLDQWHGQLRALAGDVLPQDLQTEVQQGYISEARARELAMARGQTATSRRAMEQAEARRQQQEAQQVSTAMRETVSSWERDMRARDPDYARKEGLVNQAAQALMAQHGRPNTPEQARQLVDAAYRQVNEQVKGFMPKPKPVAPGPTSDTASTRATPEPRSMKEAMLLAARNGVPG